MKQNFIYTCSVLLCAGFASCNKSVGEAIRVVGTSIDWFDRRPVPLVIDVSGKQNTGLRGLYKIGTVYSREDGSFDQLLPSESSDHYYFSSNAGPGVSVTYTRTGNTFDFGEISSLHKFICKVRLIREPGSLQSVKFISGWIVPFDRSPDTTYIEEKMIGADPGKYVLTYSVFSWTSAIVQENLVLGSGDTVSTTIRY